MSKYCERCKKANLFLNTVYCPKCVGEMLVCELCHRETNGKYFMCEQCVRNEKITICLEE